MKPLVIAHRGFSGRHPENTLAALRAAIQIGVDFVEIDVQETADGQLIVFHDYRLNRICGVPGRVRDNTAARIRELNPAVPTLAEVLRTCRGKTRVLIEIKRATPTKVAAAIGRHRMQHQVIVFTFSQRQLTEFAAVAPTIPRFALLEKPQWRSSAPTVGGLAVNYRHLRTRRTVTQLQERGWQVFAWTVNSRPALRRLAEWGVDGLITNFPDRALLERRQRATGRAGSGLARGTGLGMLRACCRSSSATSVPGNSPPCRGRCKLNCWMGSKSCRRISKKPTRNTAS